MIVHLPPTVRVKDIEEFFKQIGCTVVRLRNNQLHVVDNREASA